LNYEEIIPGKLNGILKCKMKLFLFQFELLTVLSWPQTTEINILCSHGWIGDLGAAFKIDFHPSVQPSRYERGEFVKTSAQLHIVGRGCILSSKRENVARR